MQVTRRWREIASLGAAILLMAASPPDPVLVEAAKAANKDALRTLLAQGADVHATSPDGTTALHWASHWNDLESVDLLIRAGADVNAANDLGATALWVASEAADAPVIKRLLDAGANPNAPLLSGGETAVMRAARSGKADVMELLLAKGGNPNVVGPRGQTALMWAASEGHAGVIQALVAHGANVHAMSEVRREFEEAGGEHLYFNRGGETALIFAARGGYLDAVKALLAGGSDPNEQNAAGISAVSMAVQAEMPLGSGSYGTENPKAGPVDERFLPVVEFLLESGADPNLTGYGHNALHAAILRRNLPTIQALLEHGADPNAPITAASPNRRMSVDIYFPAMAIGATPFWLAARYGQPETMRLLVEKGADTKFAHTVEGQGEITPLMAVLGMGGNAGVFVEPVPMQIEGLELDAVKIAVETGSDVAATDARGRTALAIAQAADKTAIVEFLESAK